jgi:hypothetical protein
MQSITSRHWVWGQQSVASGVVASSLLYKLPNAHATLNQTVPWLDFVTHYMTNIKGVPANEWGPAKLSLDEVLQADIQDHHAFKATSLLAFQPLNSTAITTLANAIEAVQANGFLQTRALQGRSGQSPKGTPPGVPAEDATAFPWRQALMETQAFVNLDSQSTEAHHTWVQRLRQGMLPSTQSRDYFNYINCDAGAAVSDPWVRFFGSHASRLKAIKRAYDPMNKIPGPCGVKN